MKLSLSFIIHALIINKLRFLRINTNRNTNITSNSYEILIYDFNNAESNLLHFTNKDTFTQIETSFPAYITLSVKFPAYITLSVKTSDMISIQLYYEEVKGNYVPLYLGNGQLTKYISTNESQGSIFINIIYHTKSR